MAIKHRQHHVWQHYLKSWTLDEKLYCLRSGRIFRTGTISVAVERHFYELPHLTSNDVKQLQQLVVDSDNPAARRTHHNFLARLMFPIGLVEMLKAAGKDVKTVEPHLKEYLINVLEEHHAAIENAVIPTLERLKNGDTSFYPDGDETKALLLFLIVQMFRTKGVKERAIQNVLANNGIDLARIWNVMSFMLAVDTAGRLYVQRKKRRLELVRNGTEMEFVTGDQPVVNFLALPTVPTERLSIYYPLSPDLGLILAEEDAPPFATSASLDFDRVVMLNRFVFAASHEQTFAKSRQALEPPFLLQ